MAQRIETSALGFVEQVHRGHRSGGVGGHGRQHTAQSIHQCRNGCGVVHVGAEFDDAADTGGRAGIAPAFGQRERQIHPGRLGVHRQRRDLQVAQDQSRCGVTVLPWQVLPAEHHLHQGVMGQAPGGVEPLHQHLERRILVFEGGQAAGAYPFEEVGDGGVSGQVDPQYQGVDEEADEVVERGIATTGDREANGHVVAGAELGQQHRQRRLHHHEAGGVVLAGHPGDLLLQLCGPVHLDDGATLIGHRRVGPVRRQVEMFGDTGQRVRPVGQLRGDRAVAVVEVAELGALPLRVVDVLHRQRYPAGRASRTPAGVRRAQVGHQRTQRPSVGGDVVHHDHQQVFVVCQPEKCCPQGDFRCQIEGVLCRRTGGLVEPVCRPIAGIDGVPADLGLLGGDDDLRG